MKRILTAGVVSGLLFFGVPDAGAAKSDGWKEHRGRHFLIYYNAAPKDFIETIEDVSENYYTSITKTLGFPRPSAWSYDDRVQIYIYDDEDAYVTAGRQARWSHGSASPKQKIIRTYPAAHGFFDTTLPHELAHIIFRDFVGYRTRIPLWFEEGVAMYAERAKRFGAHDAVRQAQQQGTFLSLQQMTMMGYGGIQGNEAVGLFYAHSASIVKFMIDEHGKNKFVRFCRKLKEGKPFDWALDEIYARFKNTERLNNAWVKFLENE